MNKNQRIVHGQGASNKNYSTVVFNFYVSAGFPNKSPLITMNSTINCTPINHPSAPNVGNLYNLKVGTSGLADHENYKRFSEFLVDN